MATSLTSTKTVLSKLSMNNGRQGREEGWRVFFVITIMAQSGLPDSSTTRLPRSAAGTPLHGAPLVPGHSPGLTGCPLTMLRPC